MFGPAQFRNEVIWKRTTAHSSAKRFAPVHDVILYYARSKTPTWNAPREDYEVEYLDKYYKYDDGDGRLYWRADITGPGVRHGETGQVWRGRDVTAKGRHWAYPVAELERLDAAGMVYWPPGGGMPQEKRYREDLKGRAASDLWLELNRINPVGNERLGYPTQKPEALLDRIIEASSNEGDVVLDPFCGCGTTVASADNLKRRWIGIDVTHLAIDVMVGRLSKLGITEGIDYRVDGRYAPRTIPDIEKLAKRSKHEFQGWALEQAGIEGFQLKPGADRGVDGRKVFFDPAGSENRREIIVSVKGGKLRANDVRDLIGAVQTHRGDIGVLVTLNEPTASMKRDAASLPPYEAVDGKRYPRIQILTVKNLLEGHTVEYPLQLAYARTQPTVPTKAGRKTSQPGLLREEQLELRAPRPRPLKAHLRSAKPRRLVSAKRK